jgi:hypothetical protein
MDDLGSPPMKRVGVAVIAGISVLAILGIAPSATGSGAKHRRVVCFNKGYPRHFPYQPVYKRRPGHCVFTKNNRPPDYADSVDVRGLHWKVWGRRHAYAKGKTGVNMVGVVRVRVKLYRVRKVCGHQVFSRAKFRYKGQPSGRALRLETCA